MPAAPTKIAVVIGQLGLDGSESQLYTFLEHRDRERWSPIVYVSGTLGPWTDPICELGIPIRPLHGSPITKMLQFRRTCRARATACTA